MLNVRPDCSEQRGPKNEPPEKLANNRRLTESLHQLAQTATDHQKERKLGDEDRVGMLGGIWFGG